MKEGKFKRCEFGSAKLIRYLALIAVLLMGAHADNGDISTSMMSLDTTQPKKPLMSIVPSEGSNEEEESAKELKHQKPEANSDKFSRKTKLKRDVEDIFQLDGSKQKRKEYLNQNTRDHNAKNVKRSWADVFGIVKDDPNSQEILICLALIFVFVGILLTLICCICVYWCQDRKKMQLLELNSSMHNTHEFQEHYNQVIQKQHFKIKNAAQDLEMLEKRSRSSSPSGSAQRTKSGSSPANRNIFGLSSQFNSTAQNHVRPFQGTLGDDQNDLSRQQFNFQNHSVPIVTQEVNNQQTGNNFITSRSNPDPLLKSNANIFKTNDQSNLQTLESSRQINGGGPSNQNFQAFNNNIEMGMFNNNENDNSKIEDVGGADGLEGIYLPERRTANFEERRTANFGSIQPEASKSNNNSSGGFANSLHQKANELMAKNAGYQQIQEDDNNQIVERAAGGPNYQQTNATQEDQLKEMLKHQNEAADRYQSEQNNSSINDGNQ